MTTGPRLASNRRAWIAVCCIAALAALLAIDGGSSRAVAAGGPDVTVFAFTDVRSYGSADGFAAYSLGTTSCNRGDTPLNWCNNSGGAGCAPGSGSEDHPVIAQNLYRLKSGRFEQIGMSWLKHGFASLNATTGGCTGSGGQSCQQPPAGENQLGVGCIDPYDAFTNGWQPVLGRRSEVNATTGVFPYPPSASSASTLYDKRIKVDVEDVDPALNAGATYWMEGQYIASDDAAAGNALNNASHGQVTVGAGAGFPLTLTGTFFQQQPAIYAWKTQDPSVVLVNADVPGPIVERFHVGRKVTSLGGGLWHYEYAVHNFNSDRSARAFNVEFTTATSFTNVGFKDIEHHSGEPYAGTDWSVSSSGGLLSWSTVDFANDQNANALRAATMFNFWFDADQPPERAVVHSLGLFKPGTSDSVGFTIGNELFGDGFESGGTGNWSGTGN
jgi:hypothetical protein